MQPLKGIRVVDLTHVIAGPLATHMLCVLGAEVIKIEKPGSGDSVRSLAAQPELGGLTPAFNAMNTGKKSVEIDLKSEAGRAKVLDLAKSADVFVENFRPGVAKRLGLSAKDVRAVHPNVIYCSISGWGQTGPMAQTPAYDHVIQAATGMMNLQGSGDPTAEPTKVGFPVIDTGTGMIAATAILSALLRRANGDTDPIELDVSMVDSALMLTGTVVASTRATGAAPVPAGNRGFVASPGADTLPTKDGHIALGANTLKQFRKLCAVVGQTELAEPPFLPAGLPDDAFLTNMANKPLRDALSKATRRFKAHELEQHLRAAGVPAAKVRDVHEFLTQLYPDTPGIDLPDSNGILGSGFRWLGEDQDPLRAAPTLGQDNAEFPGTV